MLKKLLIILALLTASTAFAATTVSHTGISTPWKANISIAGISSGLVGYWTFDGKDTNWTTDTTVDSSGQGNTAALVSMSTTTSPVAGVVGQALQFNGTSQYVTLPSTTAINTNVFTYIAWIKLSSCASFGVVLSSAIGGGKQFTTNPATCLLALNSTGVATVGVSTTAVSAGVWTQVAVTYDASGNFVFYINGKPAGSGTNLLSFSSATYYVGRNNNGTVFTNGTIDDVRIYNRPLAANEMAQLYQQDAGVYLNTTIPALTSGLVGYYTFNGPSINWRANQVTDVSGQGNTATLVSVSTTTSPVVGQLGQALQFNGAGQYANMGNTFDQTGASPFSIGEWFRSSAAGATIYTIVGKATLSGVLGYQFGLNVLSGTAPNAGKVGVVFVATGTVIMRRETITAYNDGKWHYALFTYDGSKTRAGILIYIDGALSIMENSDSASFSGSLSNSANFEVGARDGASQPFSGAVDDVRVYNRLLSAAEIASLYKLGI